jgi:hypothetical protein
VADYQATRISDNDVNGNAVPHGTYPDFRKRMFGNAGAGVNGFGSWIRVPDNDKKLVFLYNLSRTGGVGAAVVEIHGAVELADAPDNTAYVLLATLNAGTPKAQVTENWSYMRAKLTTAGAAAVQVGLVANEE